MTTGLLILSWLLPLLLAPLALSRWGRWLPALAVLPALAASQLVPVGHQLALEWVLLGSHLALDGIGRLFLLFSGLLWLFAGVYAAWTMSDDARAGRFRLFFLLAMAGNLLLILAADTVTFYVGFALMGLSAYGLVTHPRSQRARRAGRLYLAWTLVGEVALFSALVLLALGGDSLRFDDLAPRELPSAAVVLLLFGFGIKLALPGLHVWLPVTYAAAPPVAAAVLSGPMIKAGLLGWLRFLPTEASGLEGWGEVLLLLGWIGVALGVLAGVAQRDPRAVLGYSSIAKVGLLTAGFGSALAYPAMAPAIIAALVLFAMHHLLVKGALFLGVGEWQRVGARPWLFAGLGLLSLAMAGAPFSGGAAAKDVLSAALTNAHVDLGLLFFLSALGTVLLMARFLWLLARADARAAKAPSGASLAWLLLAALALWLPFHPAQLPLSADGLVPLVLGLIVAGLARALVHRLPRQLPALPAGDVLHLLPWRRLPRRLLGAGPAFALSVTWPAWRLGTARRGALGLAVVGVAWFALCLLLLAAVSLSA